MKPATPMIIPFHQPADTARSAVLGNVRPRSPGKPVIHALTRPGHRHTTSNPRRRAHPVRRTAVRFASQPPQTCLKHWATFIRARKRLILNHGIKAQTASNPRP